MARVNLFFERYNDTQIDRHVPTNSIIRLKCGAQFKTKNGWTKPYPAIIDTGAHTSVIPLSIWKQTTHELLGDYKMFGIAKKEECSIPVKIGKVMGIIVDEFGNQSNELNCCALLADTDNVPLIIGFKGVLENFRVVFDYKKNVAYVEDT